MKPMMNRRLREETHERFVIDLNMPESYPPIPARRTEEGGVRDRFLAAMAELPDEVTVVRPFRVDAFVHETVLYVAEKGCDTAAGTESAPLATLAEAVKRAEGRRENRSVRRKLQSHRTGADHIRAFRDGGDTARHHRCTG